MSDPSSHGNPEAARGAQFTTTHWSMVLAAAESAEPGSHEALEKLCRIYWPPVYAYIRRQGRSPNDACDLTQEFFAQFLEKKRVRLADPERGRFRSFLVAALKNFLTSEWRRDHAEKRGGGQWPISLDEHRDAETRFVAEPADPGATPDRTFEKRWVLTLMDQTLSRLGQEFTDGGQREHFDALKVFVWGNPGSVSHADVAARLRITANAVSVAVHRLRRRFGELLRQQIAQTVPSPADIDDELRHLSEVLGS